jgi:hypothetical protein
MTSRGLLEKRKDDSLGILHFLDSIFYFFKSDEYNQDCQIFSNQNFKKYILYPHLMLILLKKYHLFYRNQTKLNKI